MWRWVEQSVGESARAATAGDAWVWCEVAREPAVYRRLGVRPGATHGEIRQAYRRLARQLHPDLRHDGEREAAQREMAELNLAYAILADPERRAAYDREHAQRE